MPLLLFNKIFFLLLPENVLSLFLSPFNIEFNTHFDISGTTFVELIKRSGTHLGVIGEFRFNN